MARVLIVSTVSRQFHLFERSNIALLTSLGHEVHAAANYSDASPRLDGLPIIRHHIDAQRSPLAIRNVLALIQLIRIIRGEGIDAIHCHSPVGGVLGRIAGRLTRTHPVIYTAHGFHFFRGASWPAWAVFYPIERFLARWTDVLLTINEEDRGRAQHFAAGRIVQLPGIGIDAHRHRQYSESERARSRAALGVGALDVLLVSVGELNSNKNHETVIRAIACAGPGLPLRYVICGRGELDVHLMELAESLGVGGRVSLLGFRDDVHEILAASDVFVHPSLREGLPVAMLEAMVAGLPCLASDVRGNRDLVADGVGGLLVSPTDIEAAASAILALADPDVRTRMGAHNRRLALEFDKAVVDQVMTDVYGGLIPAHECDA